MAAAKELTNTVRALRDVVAESKGIKLAYLFGSYAEGRAMPISDIDLAVLTEERSAILGLLWRLAEAFNVPLEKISITDLSKASHALKVKILKHGIRIFGRDEDLAYVLDTIPLDAIEVLSLEKEDFYSWLKASNSIDENVLRSIIAQVEEDVRYLERALKVRSPKAILEDEDFRRAFERALHTAIEGIIDILRHMISRLSLGIAEVYRDYVEISRRKNLISLHSAEELVGFIELRHRLVHRYRGLDYSEVWEKAKALIDLWPKILKDVRAYLQKRLK